METTSLAFFVVACILYITAGAYMFQAIEADYEIQRQREILERTRRYFGKSSCIEQQEFERLLNFIGPDNQLARYVLRHNSDPSGTDNFTNIMWDDPGAASFVVSLITTIGYGHITPRTDLGKIMCIVYALFGIPLMLTVLAGTGDKLCNLCERCLRCRAAGYSPWQRKFNLVVQGVTGLVVLFIFPTTAIILTEKWTFLDAVYFVFITLTTIGFGDLVAGNPVDRDNYVYTPATALFRLINFMWTLVGLAYISMLITSITRCYMNSTGRIKKKMTMRSRLWVRTIQHKLKCFCCAEKSRDATGHPLADAKTVSTLPASAFMLDGECDIPRSILDDVSVQLVRFSALERGIQCRITVENRSTESRGGIMTESTEDLAGSRATLLARTTSVAQASSTVTPPASSTTPWCDEDDSCDHDTQGSDNSDESLGVMILK